MSAAVVLEQRLEEVIHDLPLQLGSFYTLKSRHQKSPRPWTWATKRGRDLYVNLLGAADYWEAERRLHVAAKLRARASKLLEEVQQQQGIAASLRGAARTVAVDEISAPNHGGAASR